MCPLRRMPLLSEWGEMRRLVFRASSSVPFSVTRRGGIRTRRTWHGMLPLNCKAMRVVETSKTKLTRPRPGRFPKHTDKRRCAGPSARQADFPETRLSRLASSDSAPTANPGANLARCDRKSLFQPTEFGLPLFRSQFPASTSHVAVRSSTGRSGPLSKRNASSLFPLVTQRGFTCRWP